jgi:hypothetical protein
MGQHLVLTKILNTFICMKIIQHICDVLVPYYKIISLNVYYHTPNLALMVFYSKHCCEIVFFALSSKL